MKRVAAGVLAAILLLAALAWTQRDEIVLSTLGYLSTRGLEVGPNQPVTWSSGPDPVGRPPSARPPNIVLILADDLGWNDVGAAGGGVAGGSVPTPNIDAIAAAGVDFRNGYAANATCAPSRAALMTGRYSTRFGFEFTPTAPAMAPIMRLLQGMDPRRQRELLLHPGVDPLALRPPRRLLQRQRPPSSPTATSPTTSATRPSAPSRPTRTAPSSSTSPTGPRTPRCRPPERTTTPSNISSSTASASTPP